MSKLNKAAEFTIPAEICVMVNTLSDCKSQVSFTNYLEYAKLRLVLENTRLNIDCKKMLLRNVTNILKRGTGNVEDILLTL